MHMCMYVCVYVCTYAFMYVGGVIFFTLCLLTEWWIRFPGLIIEATYIPPSLSALGSPTGLVGADMAESSYCPLRSNLAVDILTSGLFRQPVCNNRRLSCEPDSLRGCSTKRLPGEQTGCREQLYRAGSAAAAAADLMKMSSPHLTQFLCRSKNLSLLFCLSRSFVFRITSADYSGRRTKKSMCCCGGRDKEGCHRNFGFCRQLVRLPAESCSFGMRRHRAAKKPKHTHTHKQTHTNTGHSMKGTWPAFS